MSMWVYLKMDVDTGGNKPHELVLFEGNFFGQEMARIWDLIGMYQIFDAHGICIAPYIRELKRVKRCLRKFKKSVLLAAADSGELEPIHYEAWETAWKFVSELLEVAETHPLSTISVSK